MTFVTVLDTIASVHWKQVTEEKNQYSKIVYIVHTMLMCAKFFTHHQVVEFVARIDLSL
jgi:hypothetical protein